MADSKRIVIPVFDGVELLDVTGPMEILGNMDPTPEIYLVAEEPVWTVPKNESLPKNLWFHLHPTTCYEDCPQADILMVPGGSGQVHKMFDPTYIGFLQAQAEKAEYVTSVCTGALLLGAAGLLDGYLATTHWDSVSALNAFPEILVAPGYPRYVICGNRITSGGVSSGIDMALALVAVLYGDDAAKIVQMVTQYEPDPSFHSGNPDVAGPNIMGQAAALVNNLREERVQQVQRIVQERLG